MHLLIEGRCRRVRMPPLQPGVATVADNREQPTPTIASMETGKRFERAQIGFLHQILGLMLVPQQPVRQVVGGTQVRQQRLLKAPSLIFVQPGLLCTDPAISQYRAVHCFIPNALRKKVSGIKHSIARYWMGVTRSVEWGRNRVL